MTLNSYVRIQFYEGRCSIMAIKDSTGVLQQVDAQVRRVNTILRQAAETFGTDSIQYRQR